MELLAQLREILAITIQSSVSQGPIFSFRAQSSHKGMFLRAPRHNVRTKKYTRA